MYLKIRNRGRVPRECLEMVGLGNKRGRAHDTSVIGQFGSGSKFAAAAALRLGLEMAIASADRNGPYLLTFTAEPVQPDGYAVHHRIVYEYAAAGGPARPAYRYATDRTVEAFPDWDKPIGADGQRLFKVLREPVLNAYDEDKEFSWSFVEDIEPAPYGETCVYLADHPELRHMLQDHPSRYFKFLDRYGPVHAVPQLGSIWRKSDPRTTRVFILGVMVGCASDPKATSLFDYSLDDRTLLSEERILKDHSRFEGRLARLLAGLQDVRIIHAIMRNVAAGRAPFEEAVLRRVVQMMFLEDSLAAWKDAARAMFGHRLALPCGKPEVDENARQIMGYHVPADLPEGLRQFLYTLGFPTSEQVLPQAVEDEFRRVRLTDLPMAEQAKFRRAYRLFAAGYPERTGYPVAFFVALTDGLRRLDGFAGHHETQFKEIWIRTLDDLTLPPEHEVYQTLVHEARHCHTRAGDIDRRFMNRADLDLAHHAYRESGHARFPGTGIPVARLQPPREPRLVPLPGDADAEDAVAVDITDLEPLDDPFP